jgi:MATE family multidrug resistance protein
MNTASQAALLPPPATTLSEHIGRTLKLAVPVMLSRAGILIMTVVDSAMTGHAGAIELAYYGLAMAPQILLMLIGIGLLLGTVILTAKADGAGRSGECGAIWRISLIHAAVCGVLGLLLSYGGEWFLLQVGQGPDLARGSGAVMIAFAWGIPGMLLYVATTLFLEGISRPVPSMLIMLLANILNAFLNWLLIFGNWGLPALGGEGAAWATTIVRWFMFFAAAAYVWFALDRRHYGITAAIADVRGLSRLLRRIGYPMALSQGMESSAFSAMTLFAGLLGPVQVAAFQALMSSIALVFMFALGLAVAASVRVANAVGRRDASGIRYAGWVAAGLAAVMLSVFALLFASFPAAVASIYTTEPEVKVVAVAAIAMSAFMLIPDGLQAVLMGSLRGMADVWPATLLFFVAFWLVMIPAGYLLGVSWGGGAVGLVQAIMLGCITAAVLLALRFHRVSKRWSAEA